MDEYRSQNQDLGKSEIKLIRQKFDLGFGHFYGLENERSGEDMTNAKQNLIRVNQWQGGRIWLFSTIWTLLATFREAQEPD